MCQWGAVLCSSKRGWNANFSDLANTNGTIARLTAGGRAEARSRSLILVPSLRIFTSYSCRCQAKRMYLSLLWRQQWHFWVFISFLGTLNTGAGRPAVSPKALGWFHRTQFKVERVQVEVCGGKCLKYEEASLLPNHSHSGRHVMMLTL